ncbi:glycosyltransferase family 2 protein [Alteromonas sp. CYL-A6]|uniref:glycosyltransferase family 2 protein n=1 Tax=Alteromonas nitratireducens TaxID=3390813 RepID=UPI0034B01FD4
MIEFLFWCSALLIIYSYFGYPLLLMAVARPPANQTDDVSDDALPPVTIVIAAYNEEDCIEARIKNLETLDYPSSLLTVLIGSDGSKDATPAILNRHANGIIQPVIFTENRGKTSVINDLISRVETDIVVMSDANTEFAPDVIRKLVRHFSDQQVGAVCGELNLIEAGNTTNKDGVYWRYERFLKQKESYLDALLGANGANYAFRKAAYTPLPTNTVVDDFQVAMNIARAGYRVIYDAEAKATEEIAPNLQSEEGRRIRIGAGNYQAFLANLWALNPLIGWRCIAYISHKVLRWFAPHLLILAVIANLLLLPHPFYSLTMAAQVLFYLMAYWGIKQKKRGKTVSNIVAIPAFFVAMNWALLRGFIRFLRADISGAWQRTQR